MNYAVNYYIAIPLHRLYQMLYFQQFFNFRFVKFLFCLPDNYLPAL
ncbi:hypothetical protein FBZ87_10160 [Nitrospirillum amazonense]|uniref:Uncharacterized protein n=1 Tax=Nitrospirillum amazonense TaxID=28077 RepID=A0A560KGY8_9PROT|nr:hypothetical protein FBZ87_10160 [Nitrospirillum amazonense]